MMEDLTVSSIQVKVFVNGDLSRSAEVGYHPRMRYRDFIEVCKEQLNVTTQKKCRLFDSTGDEYSDDDMEYVDTSEPLFLSQGEEFSKNLSLSVYEEIRPLGEGGFGQVRLYRHRLSHTEVAIKFMDIRAMKSAEEINQVFSEMNLLRGLHHPHIVSLLETFILQDSLCIVMEYCSGGELKKAIMEHGAMNEEKVYSVGIQLCEAIRYCHNSNVIHRDLKLENILFADRSHMTIKVVDFGIAGVFKGGHTGERSDAGSLLYMAPEVFSGRDNSAAPTLDIWSIGCILYYLLTGRHPFMGATSKVIIESIEGGLYPPLPSSVSIPWFHLIRGALQVDPERRWNLLRIEEHLHKHRDSSDPCPDCLFGVEEVKVVPEVQKAKWTRRSIAAVSDWKEKNTSMKGKTPISPTKRNAAKAVLGRRTTGLFPEQKKE